MDKPERNSNLKANLPYYQLYANTVKGGRFVRYPPRGTYDYGADGLKPLVQTTKDGAAFRTYLVPFDNESGASFEKRLRLSSYFGFPREVIRVFVDTLFARGYAIDRRATLEALGDEIANNLDMRGNEVSAFLETAYRESLTYGWVGILTDYPHIVGEARSAADVGNLRPFSRVILPIDLWNWDRAPTGEWRHILIHEGYLAEYETDCWLDWTPYRWTILNADGEELASAEHGFGFIPFTLLRCDAPSQDRDDEPFGHSALRDISDKAIQAFNVASQKAMYMERATFPFLVEHTDAPPQESPGDVPLGPDYLIRTDGDLSWTTPPGEPLKNAELHLQSLYSMARSDAGIASRSEESTEAHSGVALAWEHAQKFSSVHARAENLRRAERQLWRVYSSLLDREIPTDVGYPEEYATVPIPAEIDILRAFHEMNLPNEIQRIVARGIVLKQYYHLPNLPGILRALESWEPVGGDDD